MQTTALLKATPKPPPPLPPPTQTVNSTRAVDMIGVIRRSLRCYHFAWGGVVPWVGIGLAWQAIRMSQRIWNDLGQPWNLPKLWFFWVFSSAVVYGTGIRWGLIAGTTSAILLWLAQTRMIKQRLPNAGGGVWNPAERHLHWAVIIAFTGIFWSLLFIVLAIVIYSRVTA